MIKCVRVRGGGEGRRCSEAYKYLKDLNAKERHDLGCNSGNQEEREVI